MAAPSTSLPSNPTTTTTASRIRSALYTTAVTDALGGPVEFRPRHSFPLVTGYAPNRNFNLPPGAWTDDTSMMLCLAASLTHCKGTFDIADQVKRYRSWFYQGKMSCTGVCFDIGISTRLALGIWKGGEVRDMEAQQRKINERLDRENCCGNGSLMRCVPIPLVYYADPERAEEYAGRQSAVTHPHVTCREACQVYTRMVGGVLRRRGEGGKEAIMRDLKGFEFARSEVLRKTFARYTEVGDWEGVPEREIKSSGFVVHTLEAALWAFFTTGSLREGALKVVNLGNDADTVGAVYGGLAGAYYGMEGVPREWMEGLYAKGMVDEVVEGVVTLVEDKEKEMHEV